MNITSLLIAWLITAVSFFVISKLPIGVEIDTLPKTLISAAVLAKTAEALRLTRMSVGCSLLPAGYAR